MSVKENKDLMLRYVKEGNAAKGDVTKLLALVDKYFDPKFVFHLPTGDLSLKQTKQVATSIYKSFPDANFTIDDIIATGDKVIARATMRATHKGEYLGVDPTEKKIKLVGISIDRIARGKIVERWYVNDIFGLMIQLGAIPNPFVQK